MRSQVITNLKDQERKDIGKWSVYGKLLTAAGIFWMVLS